MTRRLIGSELKPLLKNLKTQSSDMSKNDDPDYKYTQKGNTERQNVHKVKIDKFGFEGR